MTNKREPRETLAPTDIDPELQKLPQHRREIWMKSPAYLAKLHRRAEEPDAAAGAVPRANAEETQPGAGEDSVEPPEPEDEETRLRNWEAHWVAHADRHGMTPFRKGFPPEGFWRLPRMQAPAQASASRYEGPPPLLDDAEAELTALIAECRYFSREIAFQSARLTCDPRDRVQFIDAACSLVKAGCEVGKTIATLRTGGVAPVAERRQTITVEHLERKPVPASEGEGGG